MLIVTLLFLMLAPAAARRRYRYGGSSAWSFITRECERDCNGDAVSEGDAANCALYCKAAPCFIKIYGLPTYELEHAAAAALNTTADEQSTPKWWSSRGPLEPGELDRARSAAYNACVKELERALRRFPDGWPPSVDADAGHLYLPDGLAHVDGWRWLQDASAVWREAGLAR